MSHLRRKDREITDPGHIDRILMGGRFVTIALADGAMPYVVTLSYGYDAAAGRLCFHAAKAGRKLDIMARNPVASATVILDLGYRAGECAHSYESVVMSGTLSAIHDPDDARAAMRVLVGHLERPEDLEEVWTRNALSDDAAFGRFTMLEFAIDEVCAKQGQ